MGKTRDLFKKIRDTKGTFHAKMGAIKDRNGMDPTEAEDIKKRWQECTKELYKKDLHHPDNRDGMITHLECEVEWALGSITTNKASGGDRIPVEPFQILKDDAGKVLHSICTGIQPQWIQGDSKLGMESASLEKYIFNHRYREIRNDSVVGRLVEKKRLNNLDYVE